MARRRMDDSSASSSGEDEEDVMVPMDRDIMSHSSTSTDSESPKDVDHRACDQDGFDDEVHSHTSSSDDDRDVLVASHSRSENDGATHSVTGTTPGLALSKSWSLQSSHVPIYTGGNIATASVEVITRIKTIQTDEGDVQETAEARAVQLMLLPVAGNVSVVDAASGRRLASLRPETEMAIADDDDDDEDGVDYEAITAFCCTHGNEFEHSIPKVKPQDDHVRIFTCSRNLLLRQYRLLPPPALSSHISEDNSIDASLKCWTVELEHNFGKAQHTLPVNLLCLHSSCAFLATGSVDGTVRVWDIHRRYVTHVLRPVARADDSVADGSGGRSLVTALQWMPTQNQLILAVGRDTGSVAIHDLRDAHQEHVVLLTDHVSAVTCLRWTAGLQTFVTCGRDAVVNVWSVVSEAVAKSRQTRKTKNAAVAATTSVTTRYTYTRIQTLPVYEQVEGMVLVQDNNEAFVAIAGSKGCVRLFQFLPADTSGSTAEGDLRLHAMGEQPATEAFGEARGGYIDMRVVDSLGRDHGLKGRQLLVADNENNLSFIALDKAHLLSKVRTIVGHNDDILDLKLIPSDEELQRIVVATNSSKVSIFDLKDFSCQVLDRHTATVLCVDVSPCGRFLASCGKDRQMLLWSTEKNTCIAVASGHTEAVGAVALSKKRSSYEVAGKAALHGGGSFAVTASVDRTIKRWNLPGSSGFAARATGCKPQELHAFHSARAHEKDINIVAIAPNDSLVASGSQDKTIKIWKASDLSLQATLKGHKRGVWDCQFSSYDRVLVSCSGDKSIKLWSLSDNYACLRTLQGHLASVLRVRFLRGGLQLISSGADGLIKLWTIRSSQCESTMDAHSDKVWAMDVSLRGETLVSGGGDSKIAVWVDTTRAMEQAANLEKAEAIELDQRLANHLRHKEYSEALAIALQRDKPLNALKVLTALIEEDIAKGGSGLSPLKREARKWSDESILQILRYSRDWNTRAVNSHVAMLVCRALISVFTVDKLVSITGVPEIIAGIVPYAERHFDRLDQLFCSTFLLDLVLGSMGGIDAEKNLAEEFAAWESTNRLVLPPKETDGRSQIGGRVLSAVNTNLNSTRTAAIFEEDTDEVLTLGNSDSSDDEH